MESQPIDRKASTMNDHDLSPEAAGELLEIARRARARGSDLNRGAWLAPAVSLFIALLMGAFLLASVYLLPTATGPEALLISGGYTVGILVSVTAYNFGRRVTPTGWMKRYQRGLMYSFAVFAVSLALSFLVGERTPWLWVPLSIATALPLAVLGTRTHRGAR
jgi:hypothetical protein